jgi:hypothetical protein
MSPTVRDDPIFAIPEEKPLMPADVSQLNRAATASG